MLEAHICVGKHAYAKDENSYDKVKKNFGLNSVWQ
jgi:hypothetical protein